MSTENADSLTVSGSFVPSKAERSAASVATRTRAPFTTSTGRPVGSSIVTSAPEMPKRSRWPQLVDADASLEGRREERVDLGHGEPPAGRRVQVEEHAADDGEHEDDERPEHAADGPKDAHQYACPIPIAMASGTPRMVGCIPLTGSPRIVVAAAVSFLIAEHLERLDAVADVEPDRPDRRVVRGADAAREVEVAEADVVLVRRDVAHVAEDGRGERARDVDADLVLELPEREAADGQEAALRAEVLACVGIAAELHLLRGGGGIEERNDAVRRHAEQRETRGSSTVRPRRSRGST